MASRVWTWHSWSLSTCAADHVAFRFSTPMALKGNSLHFQMVVIDTKKPNVLPYRVGDVQTTRYQ